jgi:CRP-like cAMP-binding protein
VTRRARKARATEADASTFERLRLYLAQKAALTPEEIGFVRELFAARRLSKGELLQRTSEPARYSVFVARGCLRSYVIDQRGREHIIQFAPEDWWLSDPISLTTGGPATFFVDALEDSDVLLIDRPSHQRILERIPGYAAAFRTGLERHAAAKDLRIVTSLSASAEQRYLDFAARYPSIVRRVPQRMLASYLGISPETLSRLRKKLSSRGATSAQARQRPPRAAGPDG